MPGSKQGQALADPDEAGAEQPPEGSDEGKYRQLPHVETRFLRNNTGQKSKFDGSE